MEKHKKYVEEMMITFSKGKVDEAGNEIPVQPDVTAAPDAAPQEPQYMAVDVFDNSVNDLIKDFDPNGMVHMQTVDNLSPTETESEGEMEVQENQIGFEFIDGKLHISIDGNDIYLSPEAIAALKDYLNNMEESDADETSSDEDDGATFDSEDDSEGESEKDSNDDTEEESEDNTEKEDK